MLLLEKQLLSNALNEIYDLIEGLYCVLDFFVPRSKPYYILQTICIGPHNDDSSYLATCAVIERFHSFSY